MKTNNTPSSNKLRFPMDKTLPHWYTKPKTSKSFSISSGINPSSHGHITTWFLPNGTCDFISGLEGGKFMSAMTPLLQLHHQTRYVIVYCSFSAEAPSPKSTKTWLTSIRTYCRALKVNSATLTLFSETDFKSKRISSLPLKKCGSCSKNTTILKSSDSQKKPMTAARLKITTKKSTLSRFMEIS